MESPSNIWSITLLFVLRLGVPVIITLAIAYSLKRLDARWQEQARQQRKNQEATVRQPASAARPVSQRPFSPLYALDSAGALPCWMVKGCSDAMRANCAATHQPDTPCWQARTVAEGRLPAECKGCDRRVPTPYVLTETRVLH